MADADGRWRMGTKISWSQGTWNPVTGCSRVSEGCRHCYAETLSLERGWSTLPWTAANAAANVRERPERLRKPFSWKEPRRVFVNSMSDLYHELVSDAFIARVFDVMVRTPHVYQILTKRPERAATWPGPWTERIWLGASVENRKALGRLEALRASTALVRFLSVEPLLEDLGALDLRGISWVIVGGESGPGFRAMDHAWARRVRDQCVAAGGPFFFKQSAALRTEVGTRLIEADGTRTTWQQYPAVAAAQAAHAQRSAPRQLPLGLGRR
jgi:protein gp37